MGSLLLSWLGSLGASEALLGTLGHPACKPVSREHGGFRAWALCADLGKVGNFSGSVHLSDDTSLLCSGEDLEPPRGSCKQ